MQKRHKIQFPAIITDHLDQDEAYFYLLSDSKKNKILFHNYDEIYRNQGLYEQLFYDRLKCSSPAKITEVLKHTIDQNKVHFSEMRVLDFGAGNGMMGEALKKYGVSRLVGVDILEDAKKAMERDRPGIYDEYYVKDFMDLDDNDREEIKTWNLNSLVSVAALGYGDIPPKAFVEALNLISPEGWVAFNIKESFLYHDDNTGYSKTIRELIFSKYLYVNHIERYRHRLSIEGSPLYYFAVTCWKQNDVPGDFITKIGVDC